MKSVLHVFRVFCLFCAIARPVSAIEFLKPATNPTSTYCLTVAGGSNENLTPFVLATCNTSNQYQNFIPQYQVTVVRLQTGISSGCGTGMCLTATTPGFDSATVIGAPCDLTNVTQYWTLPVPSGGQPSFTQIQNWATGLCATAESNGQFVDQYTCQASGPPHQFWYIQDSDNTGLQPVKSGLLILNLFNANKCLDIPNSNPAAGFDAVACSATSFAQHFVVTSTPAVMLLVKNKCVDGGSTTGSVYQYDCTQTAHNQYWTRFLFPNDPNDGNMYMDMLSGLCMTWDPNNLNSVTMSTCTVGAKQYFVGSGA